MSVERRNAPYLLVGLIVFLNHPAVRQAHLAVVGRVDDERVVQQARGLQLVQRLAHVLVHVAHEVGVEVAVKEKKEKGM